MTVPETIVFWIGVVALAAGGAFIGFALSCGAYDRIKGGRR